MKKMPTSKDEAVKIYGMINEYLGTKSAKELILRLDQEIGGQTDNGSLKESLSMLANLYRNPHIMDVRDSAALHHDD